MTDEPKDHLSSFLKRQDKTEIKRQDKTEISACPVFTIKDKTRQKSLLVLSLKDKTEIFLAAPKKPKKTEDRVTSLPPYFKSKLFYI
jgi:hypothetical protein